MLVNDHIIYIHVSLIYLEQYTDILHVVKNITP